MYTAFAVSLVVSESILKIHHQKQCSIFRSISGFANRVLRRYLQYARVPPASLRPRFNIMNSLAAHGNAGSHYVIGQYKHGCSGYTHKSQISSVSDFLSCQFGADSAGYPIRQFPFSPGHKGWIARGCYIPLALPPSQRNLALRLHNAEGYYLPTYLPSSHCRLECRELGSPILKIDFGPLHVDFGSVWSPPKSA